MIVRIAPNNLWLEPRIIIYSGIPELTMHGSTWLEALIICS
jgi:hypothetical protein